MPEVSDIYFTAEGRPTRDLLTRTRAKGAAQPLHPQASCVDGEGIATASFRGWWRKAFPARKPLPTRPIALKEGRFTDDMLAVWLD